MKQLFYHGMKPRRTTLCRVNTMLEIIETGGLKSNRILGNQLVQGYNGLDYVSVCAKEKFYKYINNNYSAFNIYIKSNFCFIISGEVPAIKTVYIDYDRFDNYADYKRYLERFPGKQVSDLFDEWQVKDEIPLNYVLGLGIPLKQIMRYPGDNNEVLRVIERLRYFAELYNWDVVDSSISSFYCYEKDKIKKLQK